MQTEFLLSTVNQGSSRPSYFELFVMEQMNKMLRPALRHLLLYVGDTFDVDHHFENAYATVMLCLEYYRMTKQNATIVENLYGLERVSGSGERLMPLNRKQKVLSVLLSVALPRLMAILRTAATEINQRRQAHNSNATESPSEDSSGTQYRTTTAAAAVLQRSFQWQQYAASVLTTWFGATYPYIELGYDLSVIAYQLLYMTGRSVHHHPVFALLDMTLVRKSTARRGSSGSGGEMSPGAGEGQVTTVGGSDNQSNNAASNWPVALVLALVLAARTAEYLHNNSRQLASDHLSGRLAAEVPLPPVPAPANVGRGCVVPPLDASLCALCNKKRTNPCASTSGYVLCYLCLLPYVREHRSCPVTGLPCGELDIIRLYEENTAS